MRNDIIPNEALHVEVKVKMAKVRHKDILTIRYFFVEIPDSNLNEQNHIENFHTHLQL